MIVKSEHLNSLKIASGGFLMDYIDQTLWKKAQEHFGTDRVVTAHAEYNFCRPVELGEVLEFNVTVESGYGRKIEFYGNCSGKVYFRLIFVKLK